MRLSGKVLATRAPAATASAPSPSSTRAPELVTRWKPSAHGRRERGPTDWNLLPDHANVQRPVGRPQSTASATRPGDRAQPQGGPPAESRNPICPLHCLHPYGARRRERMDRPGDGALCRPVYGAVSLRLRGRTVRRRPAATRRLPPTERPCVHRGTSRRRNSPRYLGRGRLWACRCQQTRPPHWRRAAGACHRWRDPHSPLVPPGLVTEAKKGRGPVLVVQGDT